jgi:glutaminyl-tRNA synthetase
LLTRCTCRDNKLTTKAQLDAALAFCKACKDDPAEFERECGIGATVTRAQIEEAVTTVFATHAAALATDRYRFAVGKLLSGVKGLLRWADMQVVRDVIDAQLVATLGPKTDADAAPLPKSTTTTPAAAAAAAAAPVVKGEMASAAEESTSVGFQGVARSFHRPGHNYTTEHYPVTPNTMRLLKEHLARTGGQVRTRFPPEPNGILHIGHGKAINFNFAYARDHGGITFLRYDDTNPEKEEEEFFVGIKRDVEWLGHAPYQVQRLVTFFFFFFFFKPPFLLADYALE